MTRKRLRILFVCLVLLFSNCIGFFILHGDVTYLLWQEIRPHKALQLDEGTPEGLRQWTLEELLLCDGVRFTATLMLVNKEHPLPDSYEAILEDYNKALMHPDMVEPYIAMRDEIQRRTGTRIYVASDYRSREEQEQILQESAYGVAAQVGCSEHEAGLALDIYAPYFGGESFLQSRAGRLAGRISANYGYVVRYPLGKEGITGIFYEPWHFRYVGVPHAKLMTDAGLTLEEYIDALKPDTWYFFDGYFISRQRADALCLPGEFESCEISYDNTGYCILTVKP